MGTHKAQLTTGSDKAASGPSADQLVPTPEQHQGPVSMQRMAAPLPPPGNGPLAAHAGEMLATAETLQAPKRARLSLGIQRQLGNQRTARLLSGVQAQLAVSEPGDRYEREADAVANRVASGEKVARISRIASVPAAAPLRERSPDPQSAGTAAPSRQTTPAAAERAVGTVQAQAAAPGAATVQDGDVAARIQSPSAGRPLAAPVREEMEAGLGADFSSVRVHDSTADQADAKHLGAKAFTYQDHIWLGAGASSGDRKLMAHELTHVVQQGGAVRRQVDPALESAPSNAVPEEDAAAVAPQAPLANEPMPQPPPATDAAAPPSAVAEAAVRPTAMPPSARELARLEQLELPAQGVAAPAHREPPLLLAADSASLDALAGTAPGASNTPVPTASTFDVSGGVPHASMPVATMPPATAPAALPQSVDGADVVTDVLQRAADEERGLLGGLRERLTGIVAGLSSGWTSLSGQAQGALDAVRSQAGDLVAGVTGLASTALSTLQGAAMSMAQTATQLTEGISNQARTALESVTGIVGEVADAVERMDGAALRAAWNRITSFLSNIRHGLYQAVQRVFQRIVGLWQALRERFDGFARSLAAAVHAAFSRLQLAVEGMRQRLQSAWEALQSRAAQLSGTLGGILERLRAFLSRLISWGQHIWEGIRSGWNALTGRISGFVAQVRERIGAVWESLQARAAALWDSLSIQWQRLQLWVREQAGSALSRVRSLWEEITGFDIGSIIDAMIRFAPFIGAVREAAQNPDSVMRPIAASITGTIEAGMPVAAENQARQKIGAAGGAAPAIEQQPGGAAPLQRTADLFVQRVVLEPPLDGATIWDGLLTVLAAVWREFKSDLLNNVLHMLYEMVAVWDTIPRDLAGLVEDLTRVVARMRTAGMGFWRHLFDVPLIIWRRINAILLHLFPWFVLIATVVGALAGAGLLGAAGGVIIGFFTGGAGAAPGAAAGAGLGAAGGAGAGFGFAMGVGEGLLVSYIAGELVSIGKAWADLYYVEQSKQEQGEDLAQMVTSAIGAGIAGLLWAISALGARLVRGLLVRLTPGGAAFRFVVGLGRGFRRGSPFRRGPAPGGGEPDTPAPGGRPVEQVPGLYEGIDPAKPPQGYVFSDSISRSPGGEIRVSTQVTAPDGSTGSMSRGYDPATGEYIFHSAFLDRIPKPLRMVPTQPEMLPGKGTPLEAYMTMRQMRMLQAEAGTAGELPFAADRRVHMSTIINTRTIAQLAAQEHAGVPLDRAILNTHSVQYANNSIVQGGGRIASARVSGGYRTAASSELTPSALEQSGLSPSYLQDNGVPPDFEVLTGFDIDLNVVPARTPGSTPPSLPGTPPLVPQPPQSTQPQDQEQ